MSHIDLFENLKGKEEKNICVVRLSTSYWSNKKGMYSSKNLNFLKRKSKGENWDYITEDINMVGVSEVIDRITNLYECEDGIYILDTCNEKYDWEMPHIIEEYDYKLIPYE